ncbi:hypothetical protein P5673_006894 [Acropora cervicornis]|uniref:Uncharacterized protein n=1 Tax=Acropora cervicornis TaxID=6130 RepID=A0AAD9VBZ3_ACRCE|nr:hypothetical protein P5673_006894 [Acropora cervicornis]
MHYRQTNSGKTKGYWNEKKTCYGSPYIHTNAEEIITLFFMISSVTVRTSGCLTGGIPGVHGEISVVASFGSWDIHCRLYQALSKLITLNQNFHSKQKDINFMFVMVKFYQNDATIFLEIFCPIPY